MSTYLVLLYGQELLIQQLQDEVTRLRRRGAPVSGNDNIDTKGSSLLRDNTVTALRQQLLNAASHVRQLATDKRVLIEVGNRLRAELLRNGKSTQNQRLVICLPLFYGCYSFCSSCYHMLALLFRLWDVRDVLRCLSNCCMWNLTISVVFCIAAWSLLCYFQWYHAIFSTATFDDLDILRDLINIVKGWVYEQKH